MSLLSNSSPASQSAEWVDSLGLRAYEYGADALVVVVKCTLMIMTFYLSGRFIGNRSTTRDTVILTIALLAINRDSFYSLASHLLTRTTVFYLSTTLLAQASITMLVSKQRHQELFEPSEMEQLRLRPMVFPCQTTHTRLFPEKHSFSYSYLFVGVPVPWQGSTAGLLASEEGSASTAWFSVHPEDYLARGRHKNGLRGKLDDYLSLQRVALNRFPHAYLVTAPRILGFSFNPVSFWYLYDKDLILSAMILEVNNTFDERRMYLLERDAGDLQPSSQSFHNSWSKDFHVSPFNDRSGSYSLTAKDLIINRDGMTVDNNIVLRNDTQKAKLVARVFSTEAGIDPSTLSARQRWIFIMRWWWVGFLTNPRILREARILWVKKLQVYYRPEVFKTSIGRNETTAEGLLESLVKAFLTQLITDYAEPVSISYTPAAGPDRGTVLTMPPCIDDNDTSPSQSLDFHVMTPAFYSEVARGTSIEHTFAKFCFEPSEGEAMVHISNRSLMRAVLHDYASKNDRLQKVPQLSSTDQWLASCLRSDSERASPIEGFKRLLGVGARLHSSDFDDHVKSSHPYEVYKAYLRTVQRLLLADRIAFGFDGLLDIYGQLLRLGCFFLICRLFAVLPAPIAGGGTLLSLVVSTAIIHGTNMRSN